MNFIVISFTTLLISCSLQQNHSEAETMTITLPEPQLSGNISIEQTLQQRRSVREYADIPLSLEEIGQLAWAAQGITDPDRGFRTAPSAGATFPVEIYLLLTGLDEIPDGIYQYRNRNHSLERVRDGDRRSDLHRVALRQDAITLAPVVMVISGVLERTRQRYGERALRFLYMESGHIAQNVYLQGMALDIGTVVIGAFDDDGVREVLQLDEGEHPLYIMPLGKPDS